MPRSQQNSACHVRSLYSIHSDSDVQSSHCHVQVCHQHIIGYIHSYLKLLKETDFPTDKDAGVIIDLAVMAVILVLVC